MPKQQVTAASTPLVNAKIIKLNFSLLSSAMPCPKNDFLYISNHATPLMTMASSSAAGYASFSIPVVSAIVFHGNHGPLAVVHQANEQLFFFAGQPPTNSVGRSPQSHSIQSSITPIPLIRHKILSILLVAYSRHFYAHFFLNSHTR